MRFSWVLCLALGLGCLIGAGVGGVAAAREATEVSAYRDARACPAGAQAGADCRQAVVGTVSGVTEDGGQSAEYAMDVQVATGALHISFSSANAMLDYAVDGDRAVVTMWRGIPVSVSADGRTASTAGAPEIAAVKHLGESEQAAGGGVFFILGALAIRRNRTFGRRAVIRPRIAAFVTAACLGAIVVFAGGSELGGQPSRLGLDLALTGAGLVAVAGLSVWLGISAQRRYSAHPQLTAPLPLVPRTQRPATGVRAGQGGRLLRTLSQPARWIPAVRAMATVWPPVLLTVAVFMGAFITVHDGPAARAFRDAPACIGERNLATCTGDFTAVVNGIRTPAQNVNQADVSYVTDDGVINTWAEFDGDGSMLARAAQTDENQRIPLTIDVWRRLIIGAQLGSSWHWAQGDPPGDTIPAAFLAVSYAALLLLVRLRVHRRTRARGPARSRLFLDDIGQLAAGAGAIALLAYGFSAAAILMVAVMVWVGLSARRAGKAAMIDWGGSPKRGLFAN